MTGFIKDSKGDIHAQAREAMNKHEMQDSHVEKNVNNKAKKYCKRSIEKQHYYLITPFVF